MFLRSQIYGKDLPHKTVCLTFDDGPGETEQATGPGPRTIELAQFLSARRIRAAFFVIGDRVAKLPNIVREVAEMDHLIGNHTYDHPMLGGRSGVFAADQIIRTEAVLSGLDRVERLFRTPYGDWSEAVAEQLNQTEAQHLCTGPIGWDIDAADYSFWRQGASAEACAKAYIAKVQEVGNGIVLMHDSAFEDDIRSQSYTFEMAKLVVEWLQQNDFNIVPLDSVPQVRAALRMAEG